ncbi:hypothetical protein [Nocardia sp. NBC_00511]|uniref:hypothetical protein n=1 Tax=Nocardia sp. NBC_00511 TaxID=2903591 RepID=UPI0030E1B725
MGIIGAIALTALALLGTALVSLPSSDRRDQPKRLTVNDIQTRLASEVPHAYVPTGRRC